MDLYVLRHGIAEDRDYHKFPDDRDRPLTHKGIRRLERQVKGMNAVNLTPGLAITSPLVRAVQTAEIVLEGLERTCPLVVSEALAPSADPHDILEVIAESHVSLASVMVVGHEPHLSSLVSLVSSGSFEAAIRMRKGSLCKLRVPDFNLQPCGQIEWLLTPRQMIRLG